MIRVLVRHADGTVRCDPPQSELAALLAEPGHTVWIDATWSAAERPAIEALLQEQFRFHPLAIEDALQEAHLSRVDDWRDYLYLVCDALSLQPDCTLNQQELDVFLGRQYLVTLHEAPIPALDSLWEQCRQDGQHRFRPGPDHVLYLLLDKIVSEYMLVVDGLDDEVDDLELEIFRGAEPQVIGRIFQLRRTLLRLRRILSYLRETLNRLARDGFAVIATEERVYFRDVYDHVVRLHEIVEGLRDMAVSAMDSYMMTTSNRLNEVMRTLTVVTVLFAPLTFLTGFFGMNFFGGTYEVDAPTSSLLLFISCLIGLAVMPVAMFYWIARKGWLTSTLLERSD
ncbi:MAG TPA: magnesium/cobalt transporter CorA [Gemmatales bacterium]|nr:magnesium/cobalt transporter CorA [Gemmatales bacterium]HMP59035.1 magnesium/cobalt transporter CorA [Gemmatales bacterium]